MTRLPTSRIIPVAVLALAAGLPAATAVAAPAAAATTYTITDLGSLGLGTSDGSAINATGQVTGTSYLSTLVPTPSCPPVYGNTKKTCVEHPWHAFVYSNGQMTDLGTVGGGDFSAGSAVNLSGQVAGGSATRNGGSDAFFWNGQKMIDLGQQAPLNGSDSGANGINGSGQVVGQYGTNNNPQHAFLYSNGTITGLPEPSFNSGASCEADAINNTGQIAGSCTDTSGTAHLVLWHNGAVTDLGTLGTPGSVTFAQAISINNKGQIAGTVFTTGAGTSEGFLYSNGTITSLGSFLAASINDNGVMVGGPSIDNGGTVQNLNTLIPAGSGYQIQDATAINDNGQIVANATDNHALLLNPS
jgi:probable HAF family extracellular repeat protein